MLAGATIFLAAFLLFQVELLIAKLILPWFGGSAAVWLACLLFFQWALLGGYLYAHLVETRLPPALQWGLHGALLIASLFFLPILPSEAWKPSGGEDPLLRILGLLATTIGLPFLLLSSTTPLLQAWLARTGTGSRASGAIYRFYALSNAGSMLGLLSYPTLVEPFLSTRMQILFWSGAYAGFAMLAWAAAWQQRNAPRSHSSAETPAPESRPGLADLAFWILLPAAASAMLLATTNHILRNVAAIPLFWVVPLALYLLSFIAAFDHPRWYLRRPWLALFGVATIVLCNIATGILEPHDLPLLLALYCGGMFIVCMVCHGELALRKPETRRLTAYYLCISAGGAAGSLFVAVLAPMLFTADFDLVLLLPATALLVIANVWLSRPRLTELAGGPPEGLLLAGSVLTVAVLAGTMAWRTHAALALETFTERNFYGPLSVRDDAILRNLSNGNTIHGREYTSPGLYSEPISYYSRTSGIGLALEALGKTGPLHVGAIGLGAGTIAGYARANDSYRFYEINPAVLDIARQDFHYLELCEDSCDVVLGDARLSLERETPQGFDLLAVDAFSSDSIPVHLLTREAFALYWRHLKPDGILAIHVSNNYVDLAPVVALAAREAGKTARLVINAGDGVSVDFAIWVLVAQSPAFFDNTLHDAATPIDIPSGLRPWTDDYSNLWRSLRW